MCWCHWIKERTSVVGCKYVYCVKLCSLCTTVYNSTDMCNFAPFGSYSRSYYSGPILVKNFSFPWSHLLCVTYNFQSPQKCFMWTIDNPNQTCNDVLNIVGLLKLSLLGFIQIWNSAFLPTVLGCNYSALLNIFLSHTCSFLLLCLIFRSNNGFCHARLLVEFEWVFLPFIATFRIVNVKIVTRYGPI